MSETHGTIRGYLKGKFPNLTRRIADRVRWLFHERNDMGQELRYGLPIRKAELKPEDHVLEVGKCNYKTLEIAKRVHRVTVVNIDGVNRAVQNIGPRNIMQIKCDICESDLPEGEFDIAFVMAVFEHIRDDEKAAKNLYRLIRPGGKMLVYVPDKEAHREEWERGEYPDHVRPGYYPQEMRDLLEKAGFKVESCELGCGIYSAVAGEMYYGIARRFPAIKKLPRLVLFPFMRMVERDGCTPYPYRWGLYCKAVKRSCTTKEDCPTV